jgi:hypothetical protein
VGVGVSSRNFKKAVDCNRIKRLGREATSSNGLLKEKLFLLPEAISVSQYTARIARFQIGEGKMEIILRDSKGMSMKMFWAGWHCLHLIDQALPVIVSPAGPKCRIHPAVLRMASKR